MSDPQDPGTPAEGASGGTPTPGLGDFFWIGTACVICVVGAGGIGYALDGITGLTPWLTFAGLAFGVVSAVLLVIANVRRFL
jgi:hypothetical protein